MKVTADDIAQLLASPPPRQVRPDLAKAARRLGASGMQALFGGLFTLVGLAVVCVFSWRPLGRDLRLQLQEVRTAQGTVTSANDTTTRVHGVRVVRYGFAYEVDGSLHTGTSYYTGPHWTVGERAGVEYLAEDANVARLKGGRVSGGGWISLVVLIFPTVGISFLITFINGRRCSERLLTEGIAAEVRIFSVEGTRTQYGSERVYKITLASPVDPAGGRTIAVKRFDTDEIRLAERHAAAKQPMFVLYDRVRPEKLIFPEALIGK